MVGFEKWAIWLPLIGWAIWWLWWQLPKRETAKLQDRITDPKDRVDVEDTFRKTISQAIGAIAVLIGAGFALAQFLEQRDTAQKQIAVSQDQVKISQQQVQTSHDLLISNQIAKGFEQLGSDKIEVRLGGIYALEGILHMPPPDHARDNTSSPDYRQPVLEALCAFVRGHTIGMIAQEGPITDVQAALTVLGRRPEGFGEVDLSGAILSGANLSSSNLTGANLKGSNLTGVDMNSAILTGSDLGGAGLNGAKLPRANLSGASLSDANLSVAILPRAQLIGATLTNADLTSAVLTHVDLSYANLNGASLINADLTDADLTGTFLDNQEQLSQACGKPLALPKGFTLDKPCPPKEVP